MKFHEIKTGTVFSQYGTPYVKTRLIEEISGGYNCVSLSTGGLFFMGENVEIEPAVIKVGGAALDINEILGGKK